MLKSLKFHWEICFVCGDSWQKLFFLFCKMRVNYCAVHQNLVNSTVVYPHFAEEKKKSFCQESPQTKQKSQWNFNDFSIAWNSSNGHFPSRRNMNREPR
jgi:hypothetical protein